MFQFMTPAMLLDDLKLIFTALNDRSLYLNCVKEDKSRPVSGPPQPNAPARKLRDWRCSDSVCTMYA